MKKKTKTFTMKVLRVLMHQHPHLDEIVSRLTVIMYGKEVFVGAEQAPVWFIEGDIPGNDEIFDARGDLPVGCALNARFNEHREKGERIANECATTLTAKFLKVCKNPELKELLDEVLYFDTHEGCTKTMMGELIKNGHRRMPDHSLVVLDWATKGIEALIMSRTYALGKVPGEKTIRELLDGLTDRFEDERIQKYLKQKIEESMTSEYVTDLSSIVEAMYRTHFYRGIAMDDVDEWAMFALENIAYDQAQFLLEVEKIRKGIPSRSICALIGRYQRNLKLTAYWSDSPYAQKAARYCGADVVLICQSARNAQIYTSSKVKGLKLDDVTRMVRSMELPKGAHKGKWKGLNKRGNYRGTEKWYFFKGMLLNGSHTHQAEPTRLTMETLLEILQYGFHSEGVAIWCKRHGIDNSRLMRNKADRKLVFSDKQVLPKQVNAVASNGHVTTPTSASIEEAFKAAKPLRLGKLKKKTAVKK